MTLNKDGLEAAHAAYAKTTGGMLEGHPMANAITAYLSALPSDTRTDADGGIWSDGGKVYDPPALPSGDELVERLLRTRLDKKRVGRGNTARIVSQSFPVNPDGPEAATRIQSLMAEVAELTSRNAVLGSDGIAARKAAASNHARVKVLEEALGHAHQLAASARDRRSSMVEMPPKDIVAIVHATRPIADPAQNAVACSALNALGRTGE